MTRATTLAARAYLYLVSAFEVAVGLAALIAPAMVAARFGLLPQSIKGIAEIRCLYGGGVLAWGLITVGGLRCKSLSPGLLAAIGVIMGAIAATRIFSMAVDHEFELNVAAGIAEALVALACWVVLKADKAARQRNPDR